MGTAEILVTVADWLAPLTGVGGLVLALLARRSARTAEARAQRAEERAETIYQIQVRERAARFRAAQILSAAFNEWIDRRGPDWERARKTVRTPQAVDRLFLRLRGEPVRVVPRDATDTEALPLLRLERGVERVALEDGSALVYFIVSTLDVEMPRPIPEEPAVRDATPAEPAR